MTGEEVLRRRLSTQLLSGAKATAPEDVVSLLACVQAQECAHAFWSLGMRTHESSAQDVQEAFDAGRILRTHILRQTWHLVAPADIRWVLALTSPRVEVAAGSTYRAWGLDEGVRAHAADLVVDRLAGGRYATRSELAAVLAAAGLPATGVPLAYLLMHAELRGLVCSGPMRGAQHTYAVLDERGPAAAPLSPEEMLAELTWRFFAGHGPASVRDYTRWSSLTVSQAKEGLALVGDRLQRVEVDTVPHWLAPDGWQPEQVGPPAASEAHERHQESEPAAYLLPLFDELTLSYPGVGFPVAAGHPHPPDMDSRQGSVVLGLRNVGEWKRTVTGRSVTVTSRLSPEVDSAGRRAVERAEDELVRFLDLRRVRPVEP